MLAAPRRHQCSRPSVFHNRHGESGRVFHRHGSASEAVFGPKSDGRPQRFVGNYRDVSCGVGPCNRAPHPRHSRRRYRPRPRLLPGCSSLRRRYPLPFQYRFNFPHSRGYGSRKSLHFSTLHRPYSTKGNSLRNGLYRNYGLGTSFSFRITGRYSCICP